MQAETEVGIVQKSQLRLDHHVVKLLGFVEVSKSEKVEERDADRIQEHKALRPTGGSIDGMIGSLTRDTRMIGSLTQNGQEHKTLQHTGNSIHHQRHGSST